MEGRKEGRREGERKEENSLQYFTRVALQVALTSFNTLKRHSRKIGTTHCISRNTNVIVPYETSIIAEQDAVIIVMQ